MKLKTPVLELTAKQKRALSLLAVPAFLLALAGLAQATPAHVWKDQEVLTAADLNLVIAKLDEPRGHVKYTDFATSVNVAPGSFVVVPYANKAFDDRSEFSAATSAFTAKTAGDYQICASAFLSGPSVSAELDVFVNGTRDRAIAWSSPANTLTGCYVLRIGAGDTVDVRLYQNGNANIQMSTAVPTWNWLTVTEQR